MNAAAPLIGGLIGLLSPLIGGIALESGWTIHIRETDPHSVSVEVTDEDGIIQNSYEMFKARL